MSTLLRKFKVVKCPYDGEIYRVHAFDVHMKKQHWNMNKVKEWMKRAKEEDSCLICVRGPSHQNPKVELAVRTRSGNDAFITKHRKCITSKLPSLTESDKNLVREKLRQGNVDLDASSPNLLPPSIAEAIGIYEPTHHESFQSNTLNGDTTEQEMEVIRQRLHTSTPQRPDEFPDILLGDGEPISVSAIEPSLMLADGNPVQHEPLVAHLFDDVYHRIYQPGLVYPQQEESVNPVEQHDAASQVKPPALINVSSQTPHEKQDVASQAQPAMHDAATHTSMATEKQPQDTDTEDIPLLRLSQDHFREVNRMKNVMITQLMQDNVDLLEGKLQSRKRALHAMESLFEARTKQENLSDDLTLELSHIIHLKNKLIQQLLRETGQIHAQVYNTMTQN